jgi:hypothetical protein
VTRYYFLSEGYFLKAAVLSLCPLWREVGLSQSVVTYIVF